MSGTGLAEQNGAAHALAADSTTETVMVCAEVYRRQGGWRLRAVGQGYADGLAGLARDHGVVIEWSCGRGACRERLTAGG